MLPVVYLPPAEKYFKKLKDKKLKKSFKEAVLSIREDSEIGKAKSGDLRGLYTLDLYYNRINYEIAYRITRLNARHVVVIVMAGTRENFYTELKRYLR